MASPYMDVESGSGGSIPPVKSRKWTWLTLLAGAVLVGVGVIAMATSSSSEDPGSGYADAVTLDAVMDHLEKLDKIAARFNHSRSVVNGYNMSAEYIVEQLSTRTNFRVYKQHLVVPVYKEILEPKLTLLLPENEAPLHFTNQRDFTGLRYGGNGRVSVQAPVVHVKNFGCELEDFNVTNVTGIGPDEPVIFLIDSGRCDYFVKASNAEQWPGTQAAIIARTKAEEAFGLPGARVRKTGWLMGDPLITIPVLGASYSTAQALLLVGGQANISIHTQVTMEHTYNVIADSPKGNSNRTIVAGAHLDSVAEGPGLNDNGSGSAMILELALQWGATVKSPQNQVRFAWWGAEEIGLLGSYHYVDQLKPYQRASIACALNFDMMASPNGQRQVHNGTLTPRNTSSDVVERSNRITDLFGNFFDSEDIAWRGTATTGGSDFLPFVLKQIPVGGLNTGAGAYKTMDERAEFGGFANAPMDPCYHQPCDTLPNIGKDILRDITQAAATVLHNLGHDSSLMQ
eukprot:CAMPEP_0205826162 /NCGR_PEP_ID=MMETSP0206-20130828/27798_1 /ASSEMBLY_ACC=CAM_ASM_000279 /TAXON_ID=36767 /ORGANISM="Euplotes focardii, Strain TN1" /LENGTH=513 /DNA_ID=CAMNT_0053125871 /DNA_START=25 /DNA_END=1566 /DNA_ORIENTATION=-